MVLSLANSLSTTLVLGGGMTEVAVAVVVAPKTVDRFFNHELSTSEVEVDVIYYYEIQERKKKKKESERDTCDVLPKVISTTLTGKQNF